MSSSQPYPIWVKVFTLIVILAALYSFYLSPPYLSAYKFLRLGDNLYSEKKYDEAIIAYGETLNAVSSSKPARFKTAMAFFLNGKPEDDELGLAYLTDMELDKYEWEKLIEVMPEKYQKEFEVKD